jgi:hypothetical protein
MKYTLGAKFGGPAQRRDMAGLGKGGRGKWQAWPWDEGRGLIWLWGVGACMEEPGGTTIDRLGPSI